jgi:hypothetical protein
MAPSRVGHAFAGNRTRHFDGSAGLARGRQLRALEYKRRKDVETFESLDGRRILLFNRCTGELMLLVSRSVDLWRGLEGGRQTELIKDDNLVLESLYRRGFVAPVEEAI